MKNQTRSRSPLLQLIPFLFTSYTFFLLSLFPFFSFLFILFPLYNNACKPALGVTFFHWHKMLRKWRNHNRMNSMCVRALVLILGSGPWLHATPHRAMASHTICRKLLHFYDTNIQSQVLFLNPGSQKSAIKNNKKKFPKKFPHE